MVTVAEYFKIKSWLCLSVCLLLPEHVSHNRWRLWLHFLCVCKTAQNVYFCWSSLSVNNT